LHGNEIKSRRDDRTIRRNFPAAPLGLEIVFGRYPQLKLRAIFGCAGGAKKCAVEIFPDSPFNNSTMQRLQQFPHIHRAISGAANNHN
jgi:hypothetical protein